MNMEKTEHQYKFIEIENDNMKFVFSTAEYDLDFSRNNIEFKDKMSYIKNKYNLNDIKYLSQIHSDKVFDARELQDDIIEEGDALITNKKNIGIAVFTADCTPVLLYDSKNKVIGAVHSGWKGTLNHIVSKTIDKMNKLYNTEGKDIIAIIGPHNRECCYEVSEEMIETFKKDSLFKIHKINNERYLSLENCIKADLENKNVKSNNITSLKQCTYCSKDFKFHSYRKDKEKSGRLLTFAFIH